MKKNRKMRVPCGLNARAESKFSRTIAEKLRDKPVLTESVPVKILEAECMG
jgi:hypothetical protein